MKDHADFVAEMKEFAEAESENRDRWLEDLKFGFSADQWPEKLRRLREGDPDGARPCLTVNKIPAHARQILNDMRQARAAIKVLPIDDKADVETAEIFQGLIRHIEQISNADQAYSIASEYQVMMGVGYFRIDTEYSDAIYNEQDLRINLIRNPFSVYMDPYITDITGSDANACYVTAWGPRKQFKRDYPKADVVDVESTGSGDSGGWFTDKAVRLAECFYVETYDEDYVVVNGVARPAKDYDSNRDGSYDSEATVSRRRIQWRKVSGREILEEAEKPGQFIPVVRVAGEDIDIDGDRMVCGIVRRARDAQQMYNYTVSAIAERNALEPKAPWLVADESIEGHENEFAAANRSNRPFLTYNAISEDGTPLPPPQRQFPTGVNGALIQQLMGSDSDIQATIGQFAASLGETTNEKSGKAIQQRQMVGDIATFHYPDNMSRAIRQCGRVLIDLIPHYYDTKRTARILGDDGEPAHVQLDPSLPHAVNGDRKNKIYNVGVGKYDVAVTVGPSYATRRQEGMERMQAYMSTNPALWGVIGDLAVKLDDSPYSQEMAERIKRTIPPEIRGNDDEEGEPMDPEVMAQFQQLQQALQMTQQQLAELGQANQQLQQTVQGKVIEQQIKAEEHQMKMAEMEQERALKQMEWDSKSAESAAKQQEAQLKLSMQAEKNIDEHEKLASLVEIAATSAAQSQEILLTLAQSTQQNGEMLAAMLSEMARPKDLTVKTDAEGNITGGIARTLQ